MEGQWRVGVGRYGVGLVVVGVGDGGGAGAEGSKAREGRKTGERLGRAGGVNVG